MVMVATNIIDISEQAYCNSMQADYILYSRYKASNHNDWWWYIADKNMFNSSKY